MHIAEEKDGVIYATSDKGVHVLMNTEEKVAGVATAYLEVTFDRGGSFFGTKNGARHFMEHCIVKRTSNMTRSELERYCDVRGITKNAHTDSKRMWIDATHHKGFSREALSIIRSFSTDPTITSEVVEIERAAILNEIVRKKGDAKRQYDLFFARQVYTEGSPAHVENLGEAEDVLEMTEDNVWENYRAMAAQSHVLVIASNTGTPQEIIYDFAESIASSRLSSLTRPMTEQAVNSLREFISLPLSHEYIPERSQKVCLYIPFESSVQTYGRDTFFTTYVLKREIYRYLRHERGLLYELKTGIDEETQMVAFGCDISSNKVLAFLQDIVDFIKSPDGLIARLHAWSQEEFELMKKVFILKNEMGLDVKPLKYLDSTAAGIRRWGQFITQQDGIQQIKAVSKEQIIAAVMELRSNLSRSQFVSVSRNEAGQQKERDIVEIIRSF